MSSPSLSDYPPGVSGGKFSADGKPLPFAGNTLLMHLSPTSALYTYLLQLHEALRTSFLSRLCTLLPPPSWHMTIFEGVCEQVRDVDHWPRDLAQGAPLDEITEEFTRRLSDFKWEDDGPPYLMRINGMDPLEVGIGIHLEARTQDEERRIRRLRDRLAERLKLKMPNHDKYGLHISIAYLLRRLTGEQERELKGLVSRILEGGPKEFELGAPEFCTFGDMFKFDRKFYVGEESDKEVIKAR
jgi:hypothetical protein